MHDFSRDKAFKALALHCSSGVITFVVIVMSKMHMYDTGYPNTSDSDG